MKNKYGLIKKCLHCNQDFETKPRYLEYCSTPCKNPINRPGNTAWNKGIKLTKEQKSKLNIEGLKKGHGWNKGLPNERQSQKWKENNPNANGKLNNLRPKKPCNDALKLYRGKVRYATYRTIKEMKVNNEWVPVFGKYKHSWQIDHIIPIVQGFELGIDPYLLGSKKNIQFIKGEENRSKWDSFQTKDVVESITGETYGL
jgi:hypothetical protein